MTLDILYGNEPLIKPAMSDKGGIYYTDGKNVELIPDNEIRDFVTMSFSLWLKYYSKNKTNATISI